MADVLPNVRHEKGNNVSLKVDQKSSLFEKSPRQ